MEKLGAKVNVVKDGTKTLKDAINAAFRDGSIAWTRRTIMGTACAGRIRFPKW